MAGKELATAAGSGVLKALAYHLTITYVIPVAAPVAMIAIGIATGVPWFWIAFAALGAAAFAVYLLNGVDEWLARRRVEGKLGFQQAIVAKSIDDPKGIVIGLRVSSAANFPIEYEISKIATRLGDRVPARSDFEATRFITPENGGGWFYDHEIKVDSPPKPGTVQGFLEYKVNYGRQGAPMKYELTGRKQVIVRFNSDGLFESAIWQEAAS